MDNIVRINIDTYSLVMYHGNPVLRISANCPEKMVRKDNTIYKLSKMKKVYFLSLADRFYNFQISDNLDGVSSIACSEAFNLKDLTHELKAYSSIINTPGFILGAPGYTKTINEIHCTLKAYINEALINFLISTFNKYDGYKLNIADSHINFQYMFNCSMLDLYSRAVLIYYCRSNNINMSSDDNYRWYDEIKNIIIEDK